MTWKASPPAIEIAAAWTASACLGAAVGFAVARIAPFGAGIVAASVAGLFVALAGLALIGRVDRRRGQPLAPVAALEDYLVTDNVLLLDQPFEEEALLLDDPIAAGDPRVVRLFAEQPPSAAAPFAGPGEMAARIERFLGQPRGGVTGGGQAVSEDASAALHSALADIRRSLRQG